MNRSNNSSPWRIALLAGGDSDERVISLQSGSAVQAALASRGHVVVPIDPADVDLDSIDWQQFDIAFLALHGRFGEDGVVQSILEKHNVPYTGSDANASRLAFSKSAAKERLAQFGVATPPYVLIHYADDTDRIRRLVSQIGYPLVVKPDSQGSSLGVTIVRREEDLASALTHCFQYDSFGVVEQFIAGTEWTVGLLDDLVLPPIEIATPREFFDYHAKYEDDATEYRFDPQAPRALLTQLEDIAAEACRALQTRGLARVDLRVDEQGQPWVLEINTIPGLTDHSLVPKAAAKLGIDFAEFCERTIVAAFSGRPPRPYLLQNPAVARRMAEPG
jgi:D-alanine-D-alanine ligase